MTRPAIQIYDGENVGSLDWPIQLRSYREFFTTLLRRPSSQWISNVDTTLQLLQVGDLVLPITINDAQYANSYVCSAYTGTVSYALDELWEIDSRSLRTALAILIRSIAPLLKGASINRVVIVNNWLLSTNLYPAWHGENVRTLTKFLVETFPYHAILFRSLNDATNLQLRSELRAVGYHMAPSRQVYVIPNDSDAHFKKADCHRDFRLLDHRTEYSVVNHGELTANDDERIKSLYDQLYLEKYSYWNPQFTTDLIRLWRERRILTMTGLRSKSGSLDGVIGYWQQGGVMTTPLVGYDLTLPQELGLYRMLTALILRASYSSQKILNLSSGVAQFKRHRGATPSIEYTAVYTRHLPVHRRAAWTLLATLLQRIGKPLLQRYEL